jgi:hypothetical protein
MIFKNRNTCMNGQVFPVSARPGVRRRLSPPALRLVFILPHVSTATHLSTYAKPDKAPHPHPDPPALLLSNIGPDPLTLAVRGGDGSSITLAVSLVFPSGFLPLHRPGPPLQTLLYSLPSPLQGTRNLPPSFPCPLKLNPSPSTGLLQHCRQQRQANPRR